MSILVDIIAAMEAAPVKPIGLKLGIAGWHAWHADMRYFHTDGDRVDREAVSMVMRLSRTRTAEFDGFDLILDDQPNPYAPLPGARKVTA